jgi:hypothetical protein
MNQPLVHQPNVPQQQTRSLGQIIANLGPKSQLAAQSQVDPRALAAGIKPSFGSITFKGKTWGIRHRGVTHNLLVRDPQTGQVLCAAPSIDIVILKSATAISKAYYIEKYKEGDFNQPDCWSTNGQVPDPAAPHKQSNTCRGCKWDAFGSRMTEDNRKGKACSDNKRLAVVPAADLKNEVYGGPMLFKLPPSAFAGLSQLEAELLQAGYEYFSVVMRCTFDHQAAFPKIVFTPIGVLNDHQMQEVLNLQQLDVIDRILSEELFEVSSDPNQPTDENRQAAQPQPLHAAPAQEHQPQIMQPQAFQPVAPQPTPYDPAIGPLPAHLDRAQTNGAAPAPAQAFATAPQGPVQQGQPQVAPQPIQTAQAPQAAQPSPAQGAQETPEQTIARLQAELAAAQAKPAKATRKRSNPVTPAGNQGTATIVPPQGAQPAPLTTAQSTPPNGGVQPMTADQTQALQQRLPGETIVDAEDDDQGDAPSDLDDRINALMGNAS